MVIVLEAEFDTRFPDRGWNLMMRVGRRGTPISIPSLTGLSYLFKSLQEDPDFSAGSGGGGADEVQ